MIMQFYRIELINFTDLLYWNLSIILFFSPFIFLPIKQSNQRIIKKSNNHFYNWFFFFILCIISQVFADFLFLLSRGVELISEGPKPNMYVGGFGLVKFFHDIFQIVLPVVSTYLFVLKGNRIYIVLGLIVTLYPTFLFEWSKVGFLSTIMYFWISFLYFDGFSKSFSRSTKYIFILSIPLIILLFSSAVAEGYADNLITAFGSRLIQSVDSAFYYYFFTAEENLPKDYNFINYVMNLVSPYYGNNNPTIGHVILEASSQPTSMGRGPSPTFPLIGKIFFGFFGLVYSFILGLIFFAVKTHFLKNHFPSIPIVIIYIMITFAAGDIALLVYNIFLIFLILPIFIISYAFSSILLRINQSIEI
jgi:hypothetical protein